ncbi:MAG: hypothetical protein PSV35_03290, partial [bacterium]|nr:hypothetical protein [bacterium]
NNQTLTGGSYEYQPQRAIMVGNQGALISHANSQPLVFLARNNTVEQLSFTMTGINSAFKDVNLAISNYSPSKPGSLGLGQVTIANNRFNNSDISLAVADGSKDTVYNISCNDIAITNQITTFINHNPQGNAINALSLYLANKSAVRIAHLDNNRIDFSTINSKNLQQTAAINIQSPFDASNITIDSLANNQINMLAAGDSSSASGFLTAFISAIQVKTFGDIQASHLVNNQINMRVDAYAALNYALYLESAGTNLNINEVRDNRVNLNSSSADGVAMYFSLNSAHKATANIITNISNNILDVSVPPQLVNCGHNYTFAGLLLDIHSALQATISDINNNHITAPVNGGDAHAGGGIIIAMPATSGLLKVTNIIKNTITLTPFDNGGSADLDGLSSVGINIGNGSCVHSPNTNSLEVNHIRDHVISIQAFNILNNTAKTNLLTGINIFTESQDNAYLDNVKVAINDISTNFIDIESSGKVDQARGVSLRTAGTAAIKDVVANIINLNVSDAVLVQGIHYRNDFFGIINSQNTSFNQINIKGLNEVDGIALANISARTINHSGFYNNQINLAGGSGAGLFFQASSYNQTSLIGGVIDSSGIMANQIVLNTKVVYGIVALAFYPYNEIHLTANPTNSSVGISAANGGTPYKTAGQGVVTPKA